MAETPHRSAPRTCLSASAPILASFECADSACWGRSCWAVAIFKSADSVSMYNELGSCLNNQPQLSIYEAVGDLILRTTFATDDAMLRHVQDQTLPSRRQSKQHTSKCVIGQVIRHLRIITGAKHAICLAAPSLVRRVQRFLPLLLHMLALDMVGLLRRPLHIAMSFRLLILHIGMHRLAHRLARRGGIVGGGLVGGSTAGVDPARNRIRRGRLVDVGAARRGPAGRVLLVLGIGTTLKACEGREVEFSGRSSNVGGWVCLPRPAGTVRGRPATALRSIVEGNMNMTGDGSEVVGAV